MNKALLEICKLQKIKVVPYSKGRELLTALKMESQTEKSDGFCLELPNTETASVIFINDKLSDREKETVIAHELGHILSGHLSNNIQGIPNNSNIGELNYKELIADVFGAVLIAMTSLKETQGGATNGKAKNVYDN